jgi:hypothetical protein
MKTNKESAFLFAGMAMIVASLFALAQAISNIPAFLILLLVESSPSNLDVDRAALDHVSNFFSELTIFLVLWIGGRWILSGPPILEQFIDARAQRSEKTPASESTEE